MLNCLEAEKADRRLVNPWAEEEPMGGLLTELQILFLQKWRVWEDRPMVCSLLEVSSIVFQNIVYMVLMRAG